MDEFVLNGGGDKHYLSVISPQDMSPKEGCENINLSIYDDDEVYGGICGGLLYLDNFEGKIALCNLTNKEFKFLPPPKKSENSSPYLDIFSISGLGYDSKSGDYKLIRKYERWYSRVEVDERFGRPIYNCYGCTKTELYSLASDSWKEIPNRDVDLELCGVYVGGSCYWQVLGGEGQSFAVMSFNFTDESFSCLPSLPLSMGDNVIDIVECRGYVGAIAYDRPIGYEQPKESGSVCNSFHCKPFQLWVCKERLWTKTFSVALCGIENPLGLKDGQCLGLKDGRFLLLAREGRSGSERSGGERRSSDELLVYDCITNEWRKPDIFSRARDVNIHSRAQDMIVLSILEDRAVLVYHWITEEQGMRQRKIILSVVENRALLPDAKPINGYDTTKKREISGANYRRRFCRR
ncbi:uncharacterized protein LOC130987849 [Salvia miltiorrhiza]|uniref:uncharacterized protein LOC130987849 n=1 Tax=Salvia miltiorrhiza TaxID=226208 RepID=UPI0025AC7358|nr:uncharacterized protein LOC130987849 [Salvia miltiorrhiza]